MWKHLSKKTKLSCSGARKGHFVTCATREDVHYISTLENTSREVQKFLEAMPNESIARESNI